MAGTAVLFEDRCGFDWGHRKRSARAWPDPNKGFHPPLEVADLSERILPLW